MAVTIVRKSITARFFERTLRGQWFGFESYAWAVQRVSGVVILIFLLMHLYTLSHVRGGQQFFDEVMVSMQNPLVRIGEILLLWVVFFHTLNGIRLILVTLVPTINHKSFAYWFVAISMILVAISVVVLF
jgi:succinate dehydrogenase / fumarate reductase cytochrome b subunit